MCAGANNFTRIEKNPKICTNRLAGIKALECASITILKNRISGNFMQGILLVEGTSAHIEQNEIFTNFKANIAFGGEGSGDTVIFNNNIYSSRAEGIFAIEAGFSWIMNNRIHDNNDGIVLFDSSTYISKNQINENMRAGVLASGVSFPKIEQNTIFGNVSSGILVRDNSSAKIVNNKVIMIPLYIL